MATWPVTIPALSEFLEGTYYEETPNNVIRTQMDVGPAKTRQRSTCAPRNLGGILYMTAAQVATHDTFFVTTTNHGADSWDATAPRIGGSENFRYLKPPTYKAIGGGYHVALQLEMLP